MPVEILAVEIDLLGAIQPLAGDDNSTRERGLTHTLTDRSFRYLVLPLLRSTFTPCSFEVFCKVANIHEHTALGAWLLFGVGCRHRTGLGLLFMGRIGLRA